MLLNLNLFSHKKYTVSIQTQTVQIEKPVLLAFGKD